MTRKLRDIFDSLFGITKPDNEMGESPLKKALVALLNTFTPLIYLEVNVNGYYSYSKYP
jgi:hypothetical protein